MTDKQQTAVQHLMQWLSYYNPEAHAELIVKGHYEEAIDMEREQIEQAWDLGRRDIDYPANGSDYFTETYKTEP